MCERIKVFSNFLKNGGLFSCNIFTQLLCECPDQVLSSIRNVDKEIALNKRFLCNCYGESELDCDCPSMPILNHLVYVIFSFGSQSLKNQSFGSHFDLAQQIIDALIERGCDVNAVDADIGTVLHAVICGIDNDIKMNVPPEESQLSLKCLDYLLSLNKCDFSLDVGRNKFSQAHGTPLELAVERKLINVSRKLIAAGSNATNMMIHKSIIPALMNDRDVELFDLLFLAGLSFPNDLSSLSFNETHENQLIPDHHIKNKVNFSDWIKKQKLTPLSLKSLCRILIRDLLNRKINYKNLHQILQVPRTLVSFLRFESN